LWLVWRVDVCAPAGASSSSALFPLQRANSRYHGWGRIRIPSGKAAPAYYAQFSVRWKKSEESDVSNARTVSPIHDRAGGFMGGRCGGPSAVYAYNTGAHVLYCGWRQDNDARRRRFFMRGQAKCCAWLVDFCLAQTCDVNAIRFTTPSLSSCALLVAAVCGRFRGSAMLCNAVLFEGVAAFERRVRRSVSRLY